uniref:Uncharacterized protein n=1 Tax=Moniliophthora roreri TaxID=221103 RepID=A0A0W0GC23_MONRR
MSCILISDDDTPIAPKLAPVKNKHHEAIMVNSDNNFIIPIQKPFQPVSTWKHTIVKFEDHSPCTSHALPNMAHNGQPPTFTTAPNSVFVSVGVPVRWKCGQEEIDIQEGSSQKRMYHHLLIPASSTSTTTPQWGRCDKGKGKTEPTELQRQRRPTPAASTEPENILGGLSTDMAMNAQQVTIDAENTHSPHCTITPVGSRNGVDMTSIPINPHLLDGSEIITAAIDMQTPCQDSFQVAQIIIPMLTSKNEVSMAVPEDKVL